MATQIMRESYLTFMGSQGPGPNLGQSHNCPTGGICPCRRRTALSIHLIRSGTQVGGGAVKIDDRITGSVYGTGEPQ
ncbi:hypothetical protein [Mesorhizobium sp. ANAO-SY3R2]|uniref:hypothetical protein n=1 Tax=Mesorhizobium sp. ANAO-SY3R2 TaxID=3166644 RepID=UPI00367165C3